MPTRSAICVCVNDSKNRNSSTVRSRSGNAVSKGRTDSRCDLIQAGIDIASVSAIAGASSLPLPPLSIDSVL